MVDLGLKTTVTENTDGRPGPTDDRYRKHKWQTWAYRRPLQELERTDLLESEGWICRTTGRLEWRYIQFSLVQGGIYALANAHMCSTLPLESLPSVVFETVPMFICQTAYFKLKRISSVR